MKKGISDVIAAVLLILIVIVLIILIWMFILPLLDFDFTRTSISIVENGKYNLFDINQKIAGVQLKRGVDQANLVGLQFIFYIDGNSVTYTTKKVPHLNGNTVYYFSFCKDLIEGIPNEVSVAPIYKRGYKNKVGDVASRVSIQSGDLEATFGGSSDIFYNVLAGEDYPKLNQSIFDHIVSYWKFDEDGVDDYDITNLKNYGNVSFKSGLFGSCDGMDLTQVGFASLNSSYENKINQTEGTVSVWVRREGYHPLSNYNYVFALYNWSCWCSSCGNFPPQGCCSESDSVCRAHYPSSIIEQVINRMYIYFDDDGDGLGCVMGSGWNNNLAMVPLNEWHMVSISWKADATNDLNGVYSCYLDGNSLGSWSYNNFAMPKQVRWGSWADLPGLDSSGSSYVQWDYDPTFDQIFNGTLDEGVIFNRQLTDNEMKDLYMMYNNSR